MILVTALVLRIFVRTSDMEFILCLNLIQFNWATRRFSSLLQHLPLVYSFKWSCKKYKKCKNTKCEKTKRKLTVSWFIFLLCLYRLKDTAIIQVMKVMKTSFRSHRPQPLPAKQHVILYIVKHFWRVYSYSPLVPCLVRAERLVSPCYQQSYDGGSLCFWMIMPDCS